ncbi:hypothetical protein ACJRO7_026503, partial [Eucalyptus globulus]
SVIAEVEQGVGVRDRGAAAGQSEREQRRADPYINDAESKGYGSGGRRRHANAGRSSDGEWAAGQAEQE